jgi:aspartate racemase
LTKQAFQADSTDPKQRLYRTGDLGRMLPDGCLEYLGRKDFQAKIRGIWIDVAAVEAILNGQAGVEQAVVMAREDRPGIQQLIAYLATTKGRTPNVSVLRQALARSLPEMMIPARYVFLDQLPLDHNRKLDRRALPPPGRQRPDLDIPYVEPVTQRQRLIASCFGEALALDAVGLHDDFFALGGDSLLATELHLLVEERLSLLCPSEFLFSVPSVAGLDRSLTDEAHTGRPVPLQPEGWRLPLFCLHNHSGYVLEYRHLARLLGPDQPVYGVQSDGVTKGNGPPLRVEDMAAAALAGILRVQPEGPYHLCGNCFGGLIALELAQQLQTMGHRVGYLALVDTAFPGGMIANFAPLRPVGHYWDEFARLPLAQKAYYLAARLRNYFGRIGRLARRQLRFGMARPGQARSASSVQLQVLEASISAQERYRPKPYDGPVTLFSPGPPKGLSKWEGIMAQVQVVQLDGADIVRRPHLVQEPYVHELARILDEHLGDGAG